MEMDANKENTKKIHSSFSFFGGKRKTHNKTFCIFKYVTVNLLMSFYVFLLLQFPFLNHCRNYF